jgi:hypothetical protein
MKRVVFILSFILVSIVIFSQENDTIHKSYKDINDLKKQTKADSIDLYKYVDSTFSYEVSIPKWLNIKETGNAETFGGTLPVVKGIENAIIIKGFQKEEFKSFEEFITKYITGNKFGKKTLFSDDHYWYGNHELIKIENGVREKVFIFWNKAIYYHEFVLLKTPTAFLWVQFTSTPETYDINIKKFDEFLFGLKVLKSDK